MTELDKAYGGALYALAQEELLEDELYAQLEAVCHLLEQEPQYIRLIESRVLPKAERLGLLNDAFSGQVHPYLLSFMKILCERGAFGRIVGCKDAFIKAYNEAHGIVFATAVSAVPLDKAQHERLTRVLEQKSGKTVRLSVRVDPTLRGGLSVEMDGYRYDNTVAGRLEQLRRALLTSM